MKNSTTYPQPSCMTFMNHNKHMSVIANFQLVVPDFNTKTLELHPISDYDI